MCPKHLAQRLSSVRFFILAVVLMIGLYALAGLSLARSRPGSLTGSWLGSLARIGSVQALAATGDDVFVDTTCDINNLADTATITMTVSMASGPSVGTTTRVSLSSEGAQGDESSRWPSISDDGRYVAFYSYANNLVPDDTNDASDIFVHDLLTGETTRISVASDGTQGNVASLNPAISADGRYIAFESWADNLVLSDTNDAIDIFVHDQQTGETVRVSVASDGAEGQGWSEMPSISADGNYVAFQSLASDLVLSDTNGAADVFVHDRTTDETTRVSVASDGSQGTGGGSFWPSISEHGRYVAFRSEASNLVDGDTNGKSDVFVHDRDTGTTTRVSVSAAGSEANDASFHPSISANGLHVAFFSYANNLVSGDDNGLGDVFACEWQVTDIVRASLALGAEPEDGTSSNPSLSADGRYVAFYSSATRLVAEDTNGEADVFVYDLQTGDTGRVSLDSEENQGNGPSGEDGVSISNDGRIVVFASKASNLVEGDSNDVGDIFVHARGNFKPQAVDDTAETAEETPVVINVLANDSDVDEDELSVTAVGSFVNGTATISGTTTVIYTPTQDFEGTDTFSYVVSDGMLNDSATVTVTVTPVNDAPLAVDDWATTNQGTPVDIYVLANDTDVDADETLSVLSVGTVISGTVDNHDSYVTYTPTQTFAIDVFTYTVEDTGGLTSTARVTVTLNVAPVAQDDTGNTDEDTAVTIDVLANDSDSNPGDSLSVITVSTPPSGTVSISGASAAVYTPTLNFCGSDAFTYTVRDSGGLTDTATVSMTITPVNDPPVAEDAAASLDEDSIITSTLSVSDPDPGDTFTYTISVGTTYGSADIHPTAGEWIYTPTNHTTNYTDTLTVVVSDTGHLTDTATITLTVTADNDPPFVDGTAVSIDEDSIITGTLSVSDPDVGDSFTCTISVEPTYGGASLDPGDGEWVYTPANRTASYTDTLTVVVTDTGQLTDTATITVTVTADNDAPVAEDDEGSTSEEMPAILSPLDSDSDPDMDDELSIIAVGTPLSGTTSISDTVTVVYTPTLNFSGSDVFTYTVRDTGGLTDTATVSMTVTPVGDPPVAEDDMASTDEDTVITGTLSVSDPDVGDSFTYTICVEPTHGSASIDPGDGEWVYTPANRTASYTDTFSAMVTDTGQLTDTASITVTVTADNDAPVAEDDEGSTSEETPVILDPLDNDSDPDMDDELSIIAVGTPLSGTTSISDTVTVVYTPTLNFSGSDVFTYTVRDTGGLTDTATVSMTVTPVGDPPVAEDDMASTNEDTVITGTLSVSDPDVGDSFTCTISEEPTHGSASIDPGDGEWIYTPANRMASYTDTFSAMVTDTGQLTDTATITVTVTADNDAPVAEDDAESTDGEDPVAICVLDNDSDPDMDDELSVVAVGTPLSGTVSISGGEEVVYTPTHVFDGSDVFTYTIRDTAGLTDTANITVTVSSANYPPQAQDDTARTNEDTSVSIAVLDNDSDPDSGDTLFVAAVGTPVHGSASISGTTTVVYTPTQDFDGSDAFTYIVSDSHLTDTATVRVIITPSNDAPSAVNDTAMTDEDTTVSIAVLNNDSDPDSGDTLFVAAVGTPVHGSASISGTTTVVYTPAQDFDGEDAFSYIVSDSHLTDTATVTVIITPSNDAPIAVNDTAMTNEDTTVSIAVLANDSDPDSGDTLSIIAVGLPLSGTANISGTVAIIYTPTLGFIGTDIFGYTVSDTGGLTDTASVSVSVVRPILVVSPTSLSFYAIEGGSNPPDQHILVSNGGSGTLNWTTTEDISWLALSPTFGTAPSDITVSIDSAGMSAGVHVEQLLVSAGSAQGSPQAVMVTLTVARHGLLLPLVLRNYPPSYTVSGRIVDGQGDPVSGVTVSSDLGHTVTTDDKGNYTLTGLTPSSYEITPTKGGCTFIPGSRTVSVPPDAAGQDFVATVFATPTPTPSPTPTSCTEGIANGGFEYDGDWDILEEEYPAAYATATAHSGIRSMRLGILDPADNKFSHSIVQQEVVLPADATSITLRFWLYPSSSDPATLDVPLHPSLAGLYEMTESGDLQYVLVLDQEDRWIGILVWQRSNDREWIFHQFDLTSYAGQTVRLRFGVYNDGLSGVCAMHTDDVSLEICFLPGRPMLRDRNRVCL